MNDKIPTIVSKQNDNCDSIHWLKTRVPAVGRLCSTFQLRLAQAGSGGSRIKAGSANIF